MNEKNRLKEVKKKRKLENESLFIKDWYELDKINKESDTHRLEIDVEGGNGWIMAKNKKDKDHYLSTHTFYALNYIHSTNLLRSCGFNVKLKNWDEKNDT